MIIPSQKKKSGPKQYFFVSKIYFKDYEINIFVEENITQTPKITMISRLLVHKGVLEFAEAAKLIKEQNVKAQFELIGDLDFDNPASLSLLDQNYTAR